MIDRIFGQVVAHTDSSVTVMVGGVGLLLNVPRNVTSQLSAGDIELFTHLAVREDALTLYGFASQQERDVFEALIKVNGVGPRLGIAVLSTLSIDHLRDAVARENADVLVNVPGIGKKTAQKMVLELKDRIGWKLGLDAAPIVADVDTDVLATLTELGYSIVEAQSAIQAIPPDAPDDIEERLRLALRYFA
jgi:Holliday junction DNA helicase RuvA